jgi:hypothetical protein
MTQDPALAQLKRWSRPFAILLTAVLGLMALVGAAEVLALLFLPGADAWRAGVSSSDAGIGLSVVRAGDSIAGVALDALGFGQRTALAALLAACTAVTGAAVFHLRQLFALYARGKVFELANIRHIKRFGLWLAASGIVVNLAGRLFAAVTGEPSHGLGNAALALVYGGMTYVVARAMELGRRAEQELREFV